MLDVPDRRPVEDVFCTDAHYRRLFESAGLKVLDVQKPACHWHGNHAVGQRNKNGRVDNLCPRPVSYSRSLTTEAATPRNVTLRTRREAQGPQGLEGTALEYRLKGKANLSSRDMKSSCGLCGWHCFAVANSHGSRF